jgi:hypothetical protein
MNIDTREFGRAMLHLRRDTRQRRIRTQLRSTHRMKSLFIGSRLLQRSRSALAEALPDMLSHRASNRGLPNDRHQQVE